MIKTIIVGYGYSAKTFHIPFLKQNPAFELLGFVERSGPKSQADFPSLGSWLTLEEAIARVRPQLVIITTPNQTHYTFARLALELGCHLVIEKPATVTLAEARELEELTSKRHLVCSVFHNRRYDGDFMTLKKALNSDMLGRLAHVEMRFDRWAPSIRPKAWKESGDLGAELLDDLGSHLFDQALNLFGDLSVVHSWTGKQRTNSQINDSFIVLAKTPNGALLELRGGMLSAVQPIKFIAHGTRGSLLITGTDGQEAQLKNGVLVSDPRFGDPQPGQTATFFDGTNQTSVEIEKGSYGQFYLELASSIKMSENPPVTISDGIKVMKLLEAARCVNS